MPYNYRLKRQMQIISCGRNARVFLLCRIFNDTHFKTFHPPFFQIWVIWPYSVCKVPVLCAVMLITPGRKRKNEPLQLITDVCCVDMASNEGNTIIFHYLTRYSLRYSVGKVVFIQFKLNYVSSIHFVKEMSVHIETPSLLAVKVEARNSKQGSRTFAQV